VVRRATMRRLFSSGAGRVRHPTFLDLTVGDIRAESDRVEGRTVLDDKHAVAAGLCRLENRAVHGNVQVFLDLEWLVAPDFQKV
jgi:hypothetical protein